MYNKTTGTKLTLQTVIQELLGDEDVKNTKIYTHILNLEIKQVINPIDEI